MFDPPQPFYLNLLIVAWLFFLVVVYGIYFRKELYLWYSCKYTNGKNKTADIVKENDDSWNTKSHSNDTLTAFKSIKDSQYPLDTSNGYNKSFTDFDDILARIAARGKKWYIKLFICCGGGSMADCMMFHGIVNNFVKFF